MKLLSSSFNAQEFSCNKMGHDCFGEKGLSFDEYGEGIEEYGLALALKIPVFEEKGLSFG